MRSLPFVTIALFLACAVVFVLAEAAGSTRETATLIAFGAVERQLVWRGEWWRLFTSMFLHIGLIHIAVNLYFGWSWAVPMERLLGHSRFLIVYLLSGVAGAAASVLGHDVVSAGASGALFGLMGATLVAIRLRLGSWQAVWAHPPIRQVIITGVLWLVAGPFMGFDSFAHGGGLLAGGAVTWGLLTKNRLALIGAYVGIAALVALSLVPLPGLPS